MEKLEQGIAASSQTQVESDQPSISYKSTPPAVIVPPPIDVQESLGAPQWSLGIDIGTTGISAVLLNCLSCKLHPIYWLEAESSDGSKPAVEKRFRLPTAVLLQTRKDSEWLRDFKPYLQMGVPHFSTQTSRWEPMLQGSDQQQVPLNRVQEGLEILLATLSDSQAATALRTVTCGAVDLEAGAFDIALQQLAGVVVGCPGNGSDTYRFNVREAVLGARLVANPAQICFVEDAIATLLSGLRGADGPVVLPPSLMQTSPLQNTDWQGATLIICAGAAVSDLMLVNLPAQLQNLTYSDFYIRSLPYAGNEIDQDIICQLIYPAWIHPSRRSPTKGTGSPEVTYTFGSGDEPRLGAFVDGWHWQSSTSRDEIPTDLGLEDLSFPTPGEPDPANRHRLQQRLISSTLGQGLLEAARHLKLTLQQQDSFILQLGNQQIVLTRQDLGNQVFLPYIQQLNQKLNALLTQTGIPILAVDQVICTGGTASLGAIARWLHQKLPNATILQDTYGGDRASSPQENCLPACSRVAYGLATLPLHPQVMDLSRQQYSDYFLLMELLRALPNQPLSVGSIMQILERRGINTQSCYSRILALLEGHLPPGLVPGEEDGILTPESVHNLNYQRLLASPLFQKQDPQTYCPNLQQWNDFQAYLETVLTHTHQKLTEPLTANLTASQ